MVDNGHTIHYQIKTIFMEKQFLTPILLIFFNRAEVTLQVFEQIRKTKPKYLFLAADGPRPNRPDDTIACAETRKIKDLVDWDCELKLLFRDVNLGCGMAVSSAISWFFEQVEAGIILEDDCYPDPSFFPYCAQLLSEYQNEKKVSIISGNNFQNTIRGSASYYYSHYPITWGWATWRRTWEQFDFNIAEAPLNIKNGMLDTVFPSPQEKKFWTKKLEKVNTESYHIWDIHFFYSIWKNQGICITPNKNLVVNLGFFDNGTHHFLVDSTKTNAKSESMDFPLVKPTVMKVNRAADHYLFEHFFSHSFSRGWRLFRENNWQSIFKYFKARLNKGQSTTNTINTM